MDTKEAIKMSMNTAAFLTQTLLEDFSDADLLVRPLPNANHTAWQLGHLIASEYQMTEGVMPGSCPALPEGFAEKHGKATATIDDPKAFYTKKEYMDIFNKQRAASLALLDKIDVKDLDKPGPEWAKSYAPTVGSVFMLHGSHYLMHLGQFSIVRRKLNKAHVM